LLDPGKILHTSAEGMGLTVDEPAISPEPTPVREWRQIDSS